MPCDHCTCREPETPQDLLERGQIQWRRDWDVLAAGYVLGVLSVLALIGLFGG